jgi:hypothetical protein
MVFSRFTGRTPVTPLIRTQLVQTETLLPADMIFNKVPQIVEGDRSHA